MNRELSGILVIDKPEGLTSTEVVERVKKWLKVKKAGHGGTLDPLATGVLPILLNKATKVAQIFLEGDKVYEGEFELGITTDTYDITGEVLARYEVKDITLSKLKEIAKSYEGEIEQIPPPYSAAKYRGRPLYKYARDGLLIPKEPKKIRIHRFDILSLKDNRVTFYLKCSKGTYVRSLIHRIGEILECGAVLVKLRRLQKSIFTLDKALTFEELKDLLERDGEQLRSFIIPLERALEFLPKAILSEEFAQKIRSGLQVPRHTFLTFMKFQKLTLSPSEKWLRLIDPKGNLVAIIENPLLDPQKAFISYLRVFKGDC